MKIIGLNGSPHRDRNTVFLLKTLKKELQELGGDIEIVNVQEVILDCKIPFCVNCVSPCDARCLKGTKLEETYNKISESEVIVIASPVYFGTVSAQMKAFFDKSRSIRREKKWIGKYGVGMTVGGSKYGGQENALRTIDDMLRIHGFTLINDGHKDFDAGHFGICAERPAEEDKNATDRIKILAHRIMDLKN